MRGAPKLNPDLQKLVCEKLVEGLPRKRVAALAGISESTLYEWLRAAQRPDAAPELREFALAVERAEAQCQADLLQVAKDGLVRDPKLALAILGRRFPDEWGRRDNVAVESTVDRAAEAKSLRETLLERLERLLPTVEVLPVVSTAAALPETATVEVVPGE